MATRIYHRYDTKANWDAAVAAGGGKLVQGEIGIVENPIQGFIEYTGYLGTSSTPVTYNGGALLFRALVSDIGTPGIDAPVFEQILVKTTGAIPDNSTVVWNSANEAWEPTNEILSLDAYPTADGVVAWDQSEGKFTVGAAVSTVGIDGGAY